MGSNNGILTSSPLMSPDEFILYSGIVSVKFALPLLAFMITGPGTSAGVLAGIATIMKSRAVGLYVAYLLVFAIVLGYLYDFLLLIEI